MKQSFICLIAATLLAQTLYAQEKIGVYLHAGPYLHSNSYKTTGTGATHMPAFQLAPGAGLEVDIPLSEKFSLVPFVKYYGQKQMVEQNESGGMFTEDSYFRVFNTYNNLNVGAFGQYSLVKKKKIEWQLLAGLSFSHAAASANGSSYKYTSNMDGAYTVIIGSDNKMDNFDRKANFVNLSFGSRLQTHIRKLGDFKFGLVVFAPMGHMPEVSYTSEFIGDNNQRLYTRTYTKNRQFNLECSIMYRLFAWRA
ncbi:MAG: hypothetical protein EOP54_12200 [Sphingobacteriales bacterium]|nr:MAG: hypothetical protein EOP54_12200 [Sphingobacteriales bacterium]